MIATIIIVYCLFCYCFVLGVKSNDEEMPVIVAVLAPFSCPFILGALCGGITSEENE